MKIIRRLWLLSFAVVFAITLLVYANLPATFAINISRKFSAFYVSKEVFFYGVFILLITYNVVLVSFSSLLKIAPFSLIIAPRRKDWLGNQVLEKKIFIYYDGWLKGFGLLCNVLLAYAVVVAYEPYVESTLPIHWVLYLILAAFLGWLIYYFILFYRIPK